MDANGVNLMRLQQLYTTITLDGLYDLLDMNAWHESLADAAYFNAKEQSELEAARAKKGGQ